MDLKNFLARLGAEPRSDESRFIEASRSSLEHARRYREAQQFEDRLEAALRLPADSQLAPSILRRLDLPAPARSHSGNWLALAASILVVVGLASILLPDRSPDAAIRTAFVEHLAHPEPALSSRQDIAEDRQLERFAERGVVLRGALADVTYFSPCVIGGKPGVHIVMTDQAQQQMTFMLMPGRDLEQDQNFSLGDMTVRISDTTAGAVALFGHQGQDLGRTMRDLLRNIDGPMRRIAAN